MVTIMSPSSLETVIGTFTSTAPDVVVGDASSSVAVGLFYADLNLDLAI